MKTLNRLLSMSPLLLIMLLSHLQAFSQCPHYLVPPQTDMVGGGPSNIRKEPDFELRRGGRGLNNLEYLQNGHLKYKDADFHPAIQLPVKVDDISVFERGVYGIGWTVAIPNIAGRTITLLYVLDKDTCRARKIVIPKLNFHKLVWSIKSNQIVTLCDVDRKRFFNITRAGSYVGGSTSAKNNPCGYFVVPQRGYYRRSSTLDGAISESLDLLRGEQYRIFIENYSVKVPEDLTKSDIDELLVQSFERNFSQKMIWTLASLKDLKPDLSRVNKAVFDLKSDLAPLVGQRGITFVRIKQFWYICDKC